jgi:hypothetical protein
MNKIAQILGLGEAKTLGAIITAVEQQERVLAADRKAKQEAAAAAVKAHEEVKTALDRLKLA